MGYCTLRARIMSVEAAGHPNLIGFIRGLTRVSSFGTGKESGRWVNSLYFIFDSYPNKANGDYFDEDGFLLGKEMVNC